MSKKRVTNRLFNPNNIYGKDKVKPYSEKAKPLEKSYFKDSGNILMSIDESEEKMNEQKEVIPQNTEEAIKELNVSGERKDTLKRIINISESSVKKTTKKQQLSIEFDQLWTSTHLLGKTFNLVVEDERDHKERAKEIKFMATRNTKYSGYSEALQFGSIEFSKNDLVLLIQKWKEFFPELET